MNNHKGFTLLEALVSAALFMIIVIAGHTMLLSGQASWSQTDTTIRLEENYRQASERIAQELRESGADSLGVMQVSILDGAGVNNSDVLRFSIPLCICNGLVMDENGDVAEWGAPLNWMDTGCTSNYPVQQNGKVQICHYPPGNPGNPQNLEVGQPAVSAHLAHGDTIGTCANCNPVNTNRYLEYRINANGQLVRRVLDDALSLVQENTFSDGLTDLQAAFGTGQDSVDITLNLSTTTQQNRTVTLSRGFNVYLRNKND